MSDETRIEDGIRNADREDIMNALNAALAVEAKLYNNSAALGTVDELFALRKALEAIWGHDLPN